MNYYKLNEIGKNILKENDIFDYAYDAKELLFFASKMDMKEYFLNIKEECPIEIEKLYLEYIEKRKNHIPLQHITNKMTFFGYDFYVNKDVLIPRFDTEILVENALTKIKSNDKILDMCTGSGCIIISILKRVFDAVGVGVDISDKALNISKKNAKDLGVLDRVNFIKSDLFSNLKEEKFDIIISNPPYIKKDDIKYLSEEVKLYDPIIALDGGNDGLLFYKRIILDSYNYLKEDGFLFFEVGFDEASLVKNLLIDKGFYDINIVKDLNNINRVIFGKKGK